MGSYIFRRIITMVLTVFIISLLAFVVIELPPGDYVSRYMALNEQERRPIDEQTIENLRRDYGLDESIIVRYFIWIGKFIAGDMGFSLEYGKSVAKDLGKPFSLTVTVTGAAMLFALLVAFPIGVYTAVRPNSIGDYFWRVIGFLGLALPNFILALVLLFVFAKYLNIDVGGLFVPDFHDTPWTIAKAIDLLKHLWIPVIVVGMAGTAALMRILRAHLLNEQKKTYVDLARSKGLKEKRLIIKYPLRIAINPFVSSIRWILPSLISGTVITAIVLDLPTAGPIYLQAIRTEDMTLVGAFIMFIAILTVIGTLIADILLAIVDPRIRHE